MLDNLYTGIDLNALFTVNCVFFLYCWALDSAVRILLVAVLFSKMGIDETFGLGTFASLGSGSKSGMFCFCRVFGPRLREVVLPLLPIYL